jgi:acyl carrier protein
MDNVKNSVCQIIADQLGLDEEEVSLSSTLSSDLGADSLDMVELILAIEEEFETEISDSDVAGFKNVKDIIDFISSKVQ